MPKRSPQAQKALATPRKSRKVSTRKLAEKERARIAKEEWDRELEALDLGHHMHALPFEIREFVFRHVIHDAERRGKTPALVVALRGTEFYGEVLKLWYTETCMRWGEGKGPNSYSLRNISEDALSLVKWLKVDHKVMDHPFWSPLHGQTYLIPDLHLQTNKEPNFQKIIHASNLENLHLNLNLVNLSNHQIRRRDYRTRLRKFHVNYLNLVEMWLDHFKVLRILTLSGFSSRFDFSAINEALQNSRTTYCSSKTHTKAVWEAEKGKVLSWKNSERPAAWEDESSHSESDDEDYLMEEDSESEEIGDSGTEDEENVEFGM